MLIKNYQSGGQTSTLYVLQLRFDQNSLHVWRYEGFRSRGVIHGPGIDLLKMPQKSSAAFLERVDSVIAGCMGISTMKIPHGVRLV